MSGEVPEAAPEAAPEKTPKQALFRAEAVRHNTPGLFGEVVMRAPPGSWVLSALVVVALAVVVGMLAGLEVEGTPLWRWLLRG